MVRRTKIETEQTRQSILDAARATFLERGLTGTTLEDVAGAAGVTRGAIYWHFANKKALFDAMRSRVCLPTIDATDTTTLSFDARRDAASGDPLDAIAHFLQGVLANVTSCDETRETFEIMAFRCEYVGEFEKDLDDQRRKSMEIRDALARVYRRARTAGMLRDGVSANVAAASTLAFMSGLIRLWLLDTQGQLVRRESKALIAAHVDGMRKVAGAAPAAGSRRTMRAAVAR